MRKELQEIETIENYLLGNMSESEKADFEQELAQNEKLRQHVAMQESLVAGLERIGLKSDIVKAKRTLFMRKVWMWFGGVVLLSAICFLSYTNFVTLSDSRSGQNSNNHVTVSDTTNLVSEINTSKLVLEGDTSNLVTISDTNNLLTQSVLSDQMQDSRSGLDFESVELPVKQFQTFTIDPTKPNTIKGKEGTIIEIPANAFATETKGMVTIKLQEFYKLSDMVFANLTTQTKDGELIETGGMINIEAYQDSKLALAEGKLITVKFPFEEKKEGMQTFAGEKDEHGKVVWEEEMPQELENFDVQTNTSRTIKSSRLNFETAEIFTIVEDMPVFKGCGSLTSRKLKEQCTYNKMNEYLNKNAKHPRYNSKIAGKNKLLVRFMINEMGIPVDVNILRTTAPELNKYAIAAVKSLPRFTPGKQRGIPVKVQYTVPVTYNVTEGSPNGLNERELDRYLSEINKKSKEEIEKSIESAFEDSTIIESDQLSIAQGYVLSSANLGWINCDRYPLALHGKSSFNIFEKNGQINCSVILHSVRGIVSPRYIKQDKYIFPQLPNREKVSVLAFKTEAEKNYVSYYQTTHDKSEHCFDFEPLTKEKLQQITAELDAIKN